MPTHLGILGGTFDPPHWGHLRVAQQLYHHYDLDAILFVPTYQPWMKSPPTPAHHRLAMIRASIAEYPYCHLSTVDIDRQGPTYTYQTLTDLHHLYPDAHLSFITGTDGLAHFSSWKHPERIVELAHLIGVQRPHHRLNPHHIQALQQRWGSDKLTIVTIDALAISSTQCRQACQHGHSLATLVPDQVACYINDHHLYTSPEKDPHERHPD